MPDVPDCLSLHLPKPVHMRPIRLILSLFLIVATSCSKDSTVSVNPPQNTVPEVTTTAASAVTELSATAGGNVINDGGEKVTARGVCWNTTSNPTINDSKTEDGSGAGSFVSSLTDLNEKTTYYLKAYASNGKGTAYGNEIAFVTTEKPAVVFQGDVLLKTQEQVDEFGKNGYTDVIGNVTIGSDIAGTIVSLEALECLRRVNGRLWLIGINNLPTLKGLDNLESVTDELNISFNPKLTDLDALMNLSKLGELNITSNVSLNNLKGLINLTSTTERIFIVKNSSLVSLEGLDNLITVKGLSVQENDALESLKGLNNVTALDGGLNIHKNGNLIDISGFEKLVTIGEHFKIFGNENLSRIDGFSSLSTIDYSLSIAENNSLINIDGLSKLTSIGEVLEIRKNASLVNINALSKLSSLAAITIKENERLVTIEGLSASNSSGPIFIDQNPSLINLDGLENIKTVSGELNITSNDALINIDGLKNLNSVQRLVRIRSNSALDDLCGMTLLVQSGVPPGPNTFIVENNVYNPTEQDILDGNCSL